MEPRRVGCAPMWQHRPVGQLCEMCSGVGPSEKEKISRHGCAHRVSLEPNGEPHLGQGTTIHLSEACRVDARIALMDVAYVAVVFLFGCQHAVPRVDAPVTRTDQRSVLTLFLTWQQLDEVDTADVFLRSVPMLKSCPQFLPLREWFSCALRERCKGKYEGDQTAGSGSCSLWFPQCCCTSPQERVTLAGTGWQDAPTITPTGDEKNSWNRLLNMKECRRVRF